MKVLFSGGGTAGHINPALAIANGLKDLCGAQAHFVGTAEGLEADLIPQSGYTLDLIKVHGFKRSLSLGTIKTAAELPAAVAASKRIIKKFKPDVVVGTGGYVCGPVLYAAAKMKIPTFVHESNAFPGITVKILSKYTDVVAVGIDEAKKYLPNAKKIIHTGNPVRPSILNLDSFKARKSIKTDSRPLILIFGGSLGARDFNAAMADWVSSIAKDGKYNIIMGTGKLNQYDAVMERFCHNGIDLKDYPNIKICEYIYDMDVAMNAADLVISRAGASTLAELTAIGKPAVLVPSPYVTDNHQEHNARAVEHGGGAKVILEGELNTKIIHNTVSDIIDSPKKLAEMAEASRKMGVPDSSERICNEILNLVK